MLCCAEVHASALISMINISKFLFDIRHCVGAIINDSVR